MRRFLPYITLLAAVMIVVASAHLSALAQNTSTSGVAKTAVGTWMANITDSNAPNQPPLPNTATVLSDGTMLTAGPPVTPPQGNESPAVVSEGQGAWQPAGSNAMAFTVVSFGTDTKGTYFGTFTTAGTLTFSADGNSFNGPYTYHVDSPSGQVMFTGKGVISGRRLTVQPMESGTPAAATPAS